MVRGGNGGRVVEDGLAEFVERGEATRGAVVRGWAGAEAGGEVTEVTGTGLGTGTGGGTIEAGGARLRGGVGAWLGLGMGAGVGVGVVGVPGEGAVDPVRSKSAVAKPVKTLSGCRMMRRRRLRAN